MRSILLAAMLAVLLLTALPLPAQTSVAYVDAAAIINGSQRAEDLMQQLRNEFMRELDDIKKEQAELAERNDEVGRHRANLTDEQWQELGEALSEEQLQLDRKTEDLEREVEARRTQLFNRFEKQVLDTIEQVRQEKGLAIIFSKGTSGFLAVDPKLDLTEEIMARIDGDR